MRRLCWKSSPTARLQQAIARPVAQQMNPVEIKTLSILIFIVSLLGEHCNFDRLRLEHESKFMCPTSRLTVDSWRFDSTRCGFELHHQGNFVTLIYSWSSLTLFRVQSLNTSTWTYYGCTRSTLKLPSEGESCSASVNIFGYTVLYAISWFLCRFLVSCSTQPNDFEFICDYYGCHLLFSWRRESGSSS